jgi:hypothetical protein
MHSPHVLHNTVGKSSPCRMRFQKAWNSCEPQKSHGTRSNGNVKPWNSTALTGDAKEAGDVIFEGAINWAEAISRGPIADDAASLMRER